MGAMSHSLPFGLAISSVAAVNMVMMFKKVELATQLEKAYISGCKKENRTTKAVAIKSSLDIFNLFVVYNSIAARRNQVAKKPEPDAIFLIKRSISKLPVVIRYRCSNI